MSNHPLLCFGRLRSNKLVGAIHHFLGLGAEVKLVRLLTSGIGGRALLLLEQLVLEEVQVGTVGI